MFRLKNEKTLRIFSSILKSYKREKHLQPFRLFINFIKISKKVLEIVTMICKCFHKKVTFNSGTQAAR